MLTALARDEHGRPALIVGVSELNLELLRQGQPIVRDCSEVGFEGTVMIVFGHDIRALKAKFVEMGLAEKSLLDAELDPADLESKVLWKRAEPEDPSSDLEV